MTLYILQCDNGVSISHILNYWYQNILVLNSSSIILIIKNLIKLFFFKLFLHWSQNVREIFISLIT
jgi:hypothetical protein